MSDDRIVDAKTVPSPSKILSCWICPGAGFAAQGRIGWAWLSFAVNLLVYAIFFIAYQSLTTFVIWFLVVALAIATALWGAEQCLVDRMQPRPAGPAILTKHVGWAASLIWGLVVVSLVMFFLRFDVVRMYASGMAPTIQKNERVLCDCRSENTLKRGDILEFRNGSVSTWGEPGLKMIARVIAIEGDTISIRRGKYIVNDLPVANATPLVDLHEAIDIPSDPAFVNVPPDSYFVVQDGLNNPFDSRIFGWVNHRQVLCTRLYRFRWPQLLEPIE